MTRQIDRDNAIRLGKLCNLVVPEVSIASPAMNEDQYRLTLALYRIMNGHTISRGNNFRLRLSMSHGKNKREQQQNTQQHVAPHFLCRDTKKHKRGKKSSVEFVPLCGYSAPSSSLTQASSSHLDHKNPRHGVSTLTGAKACLIHHDETFCDKQRWDWLRPVSRASFCVPKHARLRR